MDPVDFSRTQRGSDQEAPFSNEHAALNDDRRGKGDAFEAVTMGERGRWLAVVCAGIYAWAVTVLPGMRQSGLSSGAALAGLLALALQLGSLAAPRRPWFRFLAVESFLIACFVSWWLAGAVAPEHSFGWFGALGFFAFTFALGSLSTPRAVSSFAAEEARFVARSPPRRSALLLVVSLIPVTLALIYLAWEVKRPAVAVLGQVLALGVLLLLLRGGGLLAENLQTRGTSLYRAPSLRRARWLLAALAVVALGAFIWLRPLVGIGNWDVQ